MKRKAGLIFQSFLVCLKGKENDLRRKKEQKGS